eukprot:jgi/Bigna1/64351/fgenesh1_kg.73_\
MVSTRLYERADTFCMTPHHLHKLRLQFVHNNLFGYVFYSSGLFNNARLPPDGHVYENCARELKKFEQGMRGIEGMSSSSHDVLHIWGKDSSSINSSASHLLQQQQQQQQQQHVANRIPYVHQPDFPKVVADMFEAFIGAVYLDSGRNLNETWRVFERFVQWRENVRHKIEVYSALWQSK